MLKSFSTKRKIELAVVATTAVGLLVAGFALLLHDYRTVRASAQMRLELQARSVAHALAPAVFLDDAARAGRVLEVLAADTAVLEAHVATPAKPHFAQWTNSASNQTQLPLHDHAADVVVGGTSLGRVVLRASEAEIYERLVYDATMLLVVAVVVLGCALLVARRFVRNIYHPITTLSATARRVQESRNYTLRASVPDQGELGQLSTDFNDMLAEIELRDRQLESEVEERTEELKRRNHELSKEIAVRARAEERLSQSEQRFKSAFEHAAIGMLMVGDGRTIQHANQAFGKLLGRPREELVGVPLRDLSHPDDREIGLYQYHELIAGQIESYQIEKRYIHRDGHPVWVLCHVSAVRDADNRYQYAIAQTQDITEAHRLSRELSHQATHDPLTGLVNRREFEARIEYALEGTWRGEREHAICYLDLDQFKVINDTCGHVAGDELLRQIAVALRAKVRNSDTVARLGGDEFGLLMENCPLAKSQQVAESVRTAIEDVQFVWDGKRFRLSASIGLVPINRESASVTEVLQHADTACYAAKDLGRNRVHVYLREDAELAKRHGEMQWVARIQAALESDEFRLFVQPIVPLGVRRTHYEHYEVLVRMVDANGGYIPPSAFLPAAEHYNLAGKLDRWMVSNLVDWATRHPGEFGRFDMCSINLSGQTLADESFLDYVIERLREAQVPSSKICFEITETAVISNLTQATRFISTLKGLGCLFALDDFGSGLSSFAYLKNLPVDYLKIDGMFVRNIHLDALDRALVRSINDIGKVMGKQTIAEFVENDAIRDVLVDLGVDYAQGYGVGKPHPIDDLVRLPRARVANA